MSQTWELTLLTNIVSVTGAGDNTSEGTGSATAPQVWHLTLLTNVPSVTGVGDNTSEGVGTATAPQTWYLTLFTGVPSVTGVGDNLSAGGGDVEVHRWYDGTGTIEFGTTGAGDNTSQGVGVVTTIISAEPGLITVHPQGIPPGTAIAAYRRWEWKGPVAAKLNAGPGSAVQETVVADDLTVTFLALPVGEYVAYAPSHPTKRLFFMVTE